MESIEMQRVPKHGPDRVYKTREQAERAQRAADRIKTRPSSLRYVPLRPATRVFFNDELRADWNAKQAAKKKQLRLSIYGLRISRVVLYFLITLNNVVVVILLLISLGLGSGTVWEALFQIPAWLSLILLGLCLGHRLKYRMFQAIKLRNLVVHTVLLVLALSTSLLFTFRIQHGLMCRDFSALEPTSCHIPQFLMVIAWMTAASAATGIIVVHYHGELACPPEQTPQPPHNPFKDLNIPRSPPPARRKLRCRPEDEHGFIQAVRYGHRVDDNYLRSLYHLLPPLYREVVQRVEEAAAGGRPFPIEEEYELWYGTMYPYYKKQPVKRENYYQDMPPPRKVEAAELEEGWIDVPLYEDDEV